MEGRVHGRLWNSGCGPADVAAAGGSAQVAASFLSRDPLPGPGLTMKCSRSLGTADRPATLWSWGASLGHWSPLLRSPGSLGEWISHYHIDNARPLGPFLRGAHTCNPGARVGDWPEAPVCSGSLSPEKQHLLCFLSLDNKPRDPNYSWARVGKPRGRLPWSGSVLIHQL